MAEDAAMAATEALKVAKDANLITMAGINASNRAWLAIENIAFGQENDRLTLDVTLKNYGSVPAVKVSGKYLAMVVGADVQSLRHSSAGEPADLFPGVPRKTPIILPPIEEVWSDILSGKRTLLVGIFFRYSFPGGSREQSSSGVYQYNVRKDAFHTRSRMRLDNIPVELHEFLQPA